MSTEVVQDMPSPSIMQDSLREKLTDFVNIQWLAQTSSTNELLMAQGRADPLPEHWPRLVGAHHQTQGQGRLGRRWEDLPGQALMFSCGFMLELKDDTLKNLQGLGPAIGLASARCINDQLENKDAVRVKWPNDLMLDDGKLAGILVQTSVRRSNLLVVIGMGTNISGHTELSSHLKREVATLSMLGHERIDLARLTRALAIAWQMTINDCARDGFAPFLRSFNELDYLRHRDVNVIEQDKIVDAGKAQGLTPEGWLQLQTSAGPRTFNVGDVSVRIDRKGLL